MPSALRAFLLAAPCALAACSPPALIKPYRMEIQQGNYISQEMVAQLKPGMTKDQVRFVLGTPLVTDVFHADRWDYVYFRDVQGRGREERKIAVIFEEGKLARVVGDVVPAAPQAEGVRPAAAAAPPSAPAAPAAQPAKEASGPSRTQDARAAGEPPAEAEPSKPQEAKQEAAPAAHPAPETKPAAQAERGFFGRILEKLGF